MKELNYTTFDMSYDHVKTLQQEELKEETRSQYPYFLGAAAVGVAAMAANVLHSKN
jgi:hypothetical protein